MNGKVVAAYFDKNGEPKLITEPTDGDLEYEKNEAGKTVYDEHGKPVYAYYKIPVFEYEKLPVVDASGKEAILKKLNIIRSYLKDSWGLDLDKIREAVLRKSKEAETMDLTKLP
ncbi:putative zinc-binding metallopeptidase [Prevotella amnii]|nr:putative zinc-binding metallopeptidase [Prevotella amnii]